MTMNSEVTEFIIVVLKCFAVMMFWGMILPKLLDYFIYNFINKPNIYDNSILVYNIFHKNLNFLNYYIDVFDEFLKQ
ncbi:endonuclease III [Clostridium sp. DJ247]|uniref:endonuclease III n=1 Tax=Clostridium sp. DJ247 TaxID=2726188 RepID=UPI001629958E|nr:endonuclease III [Clostridium sp. DJ247]MBC2580343.1 endonuclease III [Clostridium sp. DJ247]